MKIRLFIWKREKEKYWFSIFWFTPETPTTSRVGTG